nr:DUF4365 domain-containing protein [Kribbella kalugense]
MPSIPRGRRVGRAAVNALRALLEDFDHIVQEIDGQNDFGEDLYVTFTEDGRTTADMVKIQVKGGVSWRRANGYGVPVGHHAETWSDGNVPVLCVVYDPETELLYWANATDQLRRARASGRALSAIGISPNAQLTTQTMHEFVSAVRLYIGRFRGMQAVRTQLSEMSGADFDPADDVLHFVNEHGEDLIFWQRKGDDYATLLHSDLDWEPEIITAESLRLNGGLAERLGRDESDPALRDLLNVPIVGDVILDLSEAMWLAACFSATRWSRTFEVAEPESDQADSAPVEHACIDAEFADEFVLEQILDRLELEPDLIVRSIAALRSAGDLDLEIVGELSVLEADIEVVEEAMALSRDTVDEVADDSLRLVFLYVLDRVMVGRPSLPLDEQLTIVWRVPELECLPNTYMSGRPATSTDPLEIRQ